MKCETVKLEQPIFFKTIFNSLSNNKINHAYLIEGKNSGEYANFLIKSLLCQEELLYCDKCRICNQIDENNYIDMIHYDGSNESIKKGMVEKIHEQLKKTSVEGNGKIYFIESIENTTTEALNSLLKILEEPSERVYAIFTCENINRVLPTIVSRCQVYRLNPINLNIIKEKLIKEDYDLELINIVLNIEKSYDKMIEKMNDESFNNLVIEALNFIEDLYLKKENLFINTHSNLLKNFSDRESIKIFLELVVLGLKDIINSKFQLPQVYVNHPFLNRCDDDVNSIIKKIEIVMEIITDLNFNANVPLTIDRLIYSLLDRGNYEK